MSLIQKNEVRGLCPFGWMQLECIFTQDKTYEVHYMRLTFIIKKKIAKILCNDTILIFLFIYYEILVHFLKHANPLIKFYFLKNVFNISLISSSDLLVSGSTLIAPCFKEYLNPDSEHLQLLSGTHFELYYSSML